MKKLIGKTWGSLTNKQQQKLLSNASCIDGITGNVSKGGECIVDLTSTLSIAGFLAINEYEDIIKIDDNSIIYSPCI